MDFIHDFNMINLKTKITNDLFKGRIRILQN